MFGLCTFLTVHPFQDVLIMPSTFQTNRELLSSQLCSIELHSASFSSISLSSASQLECRIFSSTIKYPEANPMSFHLSTSTKLVPNVGLRHCFLIQSAECCWGIHILHCTAHQLQVIVFTT